LLFFCLLFLLVFMFLYLCVSLCWFCVVGYVGCFCFVLLVWVGKLLW